MKRPMEARYYQQVAEETVQCLLCPHQCRIENGQTGLCKTRENQKGILSANSYGRIASYGKDPIEKKPLYHYYPGSRIFSIGSYGCNLKCDYCQNYEISQKIPKLIETTPQNLADLAGNERNNLGIAYTYNEPTVWYEFVMDIAKEVRAKGQKNVLVTNGYMNPEPQLELLPFMDAMNIDLKSMNPNYYRDYCGGTLEPVLDYIRTAASQCHIELTTLLIEGLNTSPEEMERIAEFVASINSEIPLHLSRYFPAYERQQPPTPINQIEALAEVARKHLAFVYIGNVPEADANTYCPDCGATWVTRGAEVQNHLTSQRQCPKCGKSASILMGGTP